jgi:L-ornithine Nalpha-acyltransferase
MSRPDPTRFGPPIRQGALSVAPAATADEVAQCLALRALAFRGDAGAADGDGFDAACLHLRVGPDGGAVLATLRLQPHEPGRIAGYAACHYDLSALQGQPGAALELGRLCLHPDHGDPDLMRLIWAGVARAADAWGAARLIGCTSFPGTDPDALAPALGLLATRHLGPPDLRPGKRSPATRAVSDWAGAADAAGAALLPPLLRAYLALGGWVSDHLVIDADLGTCHVFTCVEIATMPEGRKRILRGLAGQGAGQGTGQGTGQGAG